MMKRSPSSSSFAGFFSIYTHFMMHVWVWVGVKWRNHELKSHTCLKKNKKKHEILFHSIKLWSKDKSRQVAVILACRLVLYENVKCSLISTWSIQLIVYLIKLLFNCIQNRFVFVWYILIIHINFVFFKNIHMHACI